MRTLMVASTGGHLMELYALRHRLAPVAESFQWVTFDTPQSRALLTGEDVIMVPEVVPRDVKGVITALRPARRLIRGSGAERIVSTGAAVAMAFLPSGRQMGLGTHYIESAARTSGPSATGRMLEKLNASSLYTQHPGWAGRPWSYGGSVFDGFESIPNTGPRLERVLVSLGTSPFPFPRLVERLVGLLPRHVDVVWQTGSTAEPARPGRVVGAMAHDELLAEMERADVIVSHAGVGTALAALSVGKCPVLVPRREDRAEHVDDHQVQIASELSARGLAVTVDASTLDIQHLEQATSLSVRFTAPPPFRLDDHRTTRPRGALR